MTRITRVEVIDENGRSYVNWKEDNDITLSYQDDGRTLKVFVNKVKPKSPVEEAYKDWMGEYPPTTPSVDNTDDIRWRAYQMGYNASQKSEKEQQIKELVRECVKWCEENPEKSVEDYLTPQKRGDRIHKEVENEIEKLQEKNWYVDAKTLLKSNWEPKPQTPEKTEKSLKEAFVKAQQTEEWKETQRKIDGKNPPEFLKFELGKTLEGLIEEWWCDVFTRNSDLSMEESIDCLVTMICYWLPKEQSAKGTQNAYVECVVEGFNDCLNKIKSKLRNKKDT